MSSATRVLQSAREPRAHTNPFITQLFRSLAGAGVEVYPFTWRTAILGRYDVIHLHWPEYLLRGPNHVVRVLARFLFAVWLLRLAVCKPPIVQTLHNKGSHEYGSPFERRLLGILEGRVNSRIFMVDDDDVRAEDQIIPHGDYRDWFASIEREDRVPGRFAFVGIVRPYKGVDELITAFRDLRDRTRSLTISGRSLSPHLASRLQTLANKDDRVSLDLRHVSEEQIVAYVTSAEVIVLPYREVYNSGALLLALSLDRPVLVRSSRTVDALALEVGSEWIITFSGELTPEVLERALAQSQRVRGISPSLAGRSWAQIGALHSRAYERMLGRLRAE
jgi:beta-1,4-mannosyltransferase